ncbi:AraC family transcriptional regulator [Dechloromonas sp. A34]|uniref:AraC family transcriptional regulator n=1 Tax=Dechloromonas sp. A34 TaxID=447588 RepID=UPI0022489F61|nr:AraC family transcriptional regulator [Dechloromonas sp. A34]
MDVLSDVFAAVRFSGGVFLDAEFTAPWCVVSQVGPEEFEAQGRMPAHLIAYHYVVDGRLFVRVGDGPALAVQAGEIVLLPRNDGHVLGSAPGLRPVIVDNLIHGPSPEAPALLRYGGGGEPTRIVCGYLGCEMPDNLLLKALPPLLKLGVRDGSGGAWLESSFRHAAQAYGVSDSGSAAVLGKLAELLFVEGVRRYLAALPEGQTGWLSGLRDRMVGRALALLHGDVAHPWTTEELAQAVGLSRSAFAERFTGLIGVPPMRYLATWRLQLAAARLRESTASTTQIAGEIGYESDAAFNRAFKRAFGTTPAAWRRPG